MPRTREHVPEPVGMHRDRMNIAVASGKGGTGKTTLSLCIAALLAREGTRVALLDCDVEEPNLNLFLKAPIDKLKTVTALVPEADEERCTGCGACERICAFSAIVLIKDKPLVLPDMCHSCGGCVRVCPEGALSEIEKEIGVIESGQAGGVDYAGGRLNIGEPAAPPLIREVKKMHHEADVRILDCPPGTSCPVIESVRGCGFLLLVTEPTPFGLNDLGLAVGMARALSLPFGVAINRAGDTDGLITDYCMEEGIDIIARIPNDRAIAEACSRGECAPYILERYREEIARMTAHITAGNARCVES